MPRLLDDIDGENGVGESALQIDLAREIAQWTIDRGAPVGLHLREQELAQHFGISRSPVRAALQLLGRHGLVEQRPNRGFFLACNGAELSRAMELLPESTADELYRAIVHAWFDRELPDVVAAAELQRRFEHSRTTISRVLKRLADDGIIAPAAGKGWKLEPNLATRTAYLESYRFRAVIEPAAILLPSFGLDRRLAERSRLRHERILAPGASPGTREIVDADLEFHQLIGLSSGNQFFAQAISRQNSIRRLTEVLSQPDNERLKISSTEHLAILDALEAGNRPAAAELMRRHLDTSMSFQPEFRAG